MQSKKISKNVPHEYLKRKCENMKRVYEKMKLIIPAKS